MAGAASTSCCRGGAGGLQPLRATVPFQLQQRRGASGDGGRAGNCGYLLHQPSSGGAVLRVVTDTGGPLPGTGSVWSWSAAAVCCNINSLPPRPAPGGAARPRSGLSGATVTSERPGGQRVELRPKLGKGGEGEARGEQNVTAGGGGGGGRGAVGTKPSSGPTRGESSARGWLPKPGPLFGTAVLSGDDSVSPNSSSVASWRFLPDYFRNNDWNRTFW